MSRLREFSDFLKVILRHDDDDGSANFSEGTSIKISYSIHFVRVCWGGGINY
jgi:hypothetical protein